MKEKNQKVASGVVVFLLIWWEQFSCSAEIQQAFLFWPLHLLVLRAVAMPYPVHLLPMRTDDMGARICVERWLGGIVVVTPVFVEVWSRCGGMTGVMLDQSVILVLLLTVHSHVRPIGGSGCRGLGGPWLAVLLEGSTCPLDEAEVS
jgi:hypothetical protein